MSRWRLSGKRSTREHWTITGLVNKGRVIDESNVRGAAVGAALLQALQQADELLVRVQLKEAANWTLTADMPGWPLLLLQCAAAGAATGG